MVYRPSINPNLAFVLIPFKPPFDSYYEEIIKPAARSVGLETRKADEIYSTGPIIQDIWKQIWAASVVIADVTDKNPNVNYELGICHTLAVPTVIITQRFDDVPFDYRHRRCILYDTKEVDWQRRLNKAIVATLKQVLAGEDASPELGWPYDTSPYRLEQKIGPLVPAVDARDVVIRGARMVRDAVAYAFGPRGAHISVNVGENRHCNYRQGEAIASSIHSSDRLEEIGISQAVDLAREMRGRVGDGSKTAVLLFQGMLDQGSRALKRNHTVSEVLRGMERAVETIVSAVKSQSKPVGRDSLMQVARTASGGEPMIAGLVVEACRKAGRDGLVVIEQTNSVETTLEVQEGMHFDRGYIDSALISSTETQECELENAYILIYEHKISSLKDLLPLLELVAVAKSPLLIIADDVEGEALATLVVNRKEGTLDCLAVKAPGFSDRRKAMLQDIAILTGGTTISLGSGRSLATVTLRDLGRARKVIVTHDGTTILGGAGESNMGEHVRAIREELSRSTEAFAIETLRERLAKLSGAIASIRIGGINSQDSVDATYSAESAMHSTQRAIEEGVVLGGGLCLLQGATVLRKLSFSKPGEVAGVKAVADAVEEPVRQLLLNSKMDPTEILRKIKRAKKPRTGFNSETGNLQDLSAAGVLDPVVTVTYSLQLAFSHARAVLEAAAWESTPSDSREQLERGPGGQRGPQTAARPR